MQPGAMESPTLSRSRSFSLHFLFTFVSLLEISLSRVGGFGLKRVNYGYSSRYIVI